MLIAQILSLSLTLSLSYSLSLSLNALSVLKEQVYLSLCCTFKTVVSIRTGP